MGFFCGQQLNHFRSQIFADFLKESSERLQVNVRYLKEEAELGTAGGIYHYRDELMK